MVYVFGIDLPIMEIMVVLVLLILFALFLAVIEILRLRKLIIMELEAPVSVSHQDAYVPYERKKAAESNNKKKPIEAKIERPMQAEKKPSFFASMFKKKQPAGPEKKQEIRLESINFGPEKKPSFFSNLFRKKPAQRPALNARDMKARPAQPNPRLQVLENYLRSCLQRRVDMKIMNNALLARGWKQEEINDALNDIRNNK